MLLGFEHVNMVSSDVVATIQFYCGLLGLEEVHRQSSGESDEVVFLKIPGGGMLEIVGQAVPVSTPARRIGRTEAGLRHITFAVDDVDTWIARLAAEGVTVIEKPRPAVVTTLFRKVAFVCDPDGVVIELVERV